MSTADVIIVGAGVAGLSLAYHLAPHRRVHVVDQGPEPGTEATAQTAAMVRTLVDDPVERVLAVRSTRWFSDPGGDWPAPPPARTTGALLGLGLDPHHLDDAVAHLRAAGLAIETVQANVVPRWARPEGWRHAWWVPSAQIASPEVMLQGFAAVLTAHGGTLTLGTRVTGFIGDGRIAGVQTEQGPLTAPAVVIAGGAWARPLGAFTGLSRRLLPLRRSMWRTAPHALADAEAPWLWLDDVGLYVRPEGDRFLVSACDEQPEAPPLQPGSTGPADPAMEALVRQRLARAAPAIADVPFVEGWSGLRTFAPDRRPLLGPDPAREGLWWLAGLGGAGITCAVAAAEAVAGWLRDEPVDWLPRRPVDPGRPELRRFPVRLQGEWAATVLVDVE